METIRIAVGSKRAPKLEAVREAQLDGTIKTRAQALELVDRLVEAEKG